jgi:alpha-tubulin suppressor-like RCC1 family protein
VAVLPDRIFKQVAAGSYHTVALDSDGKLWSWGSDGEGQLGDSAALADQPTPKAVLSDRIFKQVTAGSGHTVALDSTGKLWSWGIDSYGQLGNDTALANQSIPVAVLSDLSFSEVSTNGGHAVAIDSNDKLWSWGYDFSGQLGNDTAKTNQTTPVAVLSDLSFSRVAAGDQHTMAIESTGKLWSWGSDGYGQLGDSVALTDQSTPVVVSPGEIFSQVFAGAGHTVAIDSTGKLWSWGWDGYGQLGNDTALADRSTPVAVAGW